MLSAVSSYMVRSVRQFVSLVPGNVQQNLELHLSFSSYMVRSVHQFVSLVPGNVQQNLELHLSFNSYMVRSVCQFVSLVLTNIAISLYPSNTGSTTIYWVQLEYWVQLALIVSKRRHLKHLPIHVGQHIGLWAPAQECARMRMQGKLHTCYNQNSPTNAGTSKNMREVIS